MKLKIKLGLLCSPACLEAFSTLNKQRFLPRDAYWISKAADVIEREHKSYQRARGDAIRDLGVKLKDDQWAIPSGDTDALQKFIDRMKPLDDRAITIILHEKLDWPADVPISAQEQRVLDQAGFLKAQTFEEPKEDVPESAPKSSRKKRSNSAPNVPHHN